MAPPDYGHTLRGLTINLLVREVDAALAFQRGVLDAEAVYADRNFAVVRKGAAEWILHADHAHSDHPLGASLGVGLASGVGAEIRLHGRDPDAAGAAARRRGYSVLDGATDKPHGLREAYILDPDGYLRVPDIPLGK